MIDLETEQLISLHDVPKFLPPRPDGKRLHISTVYRWTLRGIRGVRLEILRIGGTTYTSREALKRFASPTAMLHEPAGQNSAERQQQIERAVQQLDEILYRRKSKLRHQERSASR